MNLVPFRNVLLENGVSLPVFIYHMPETANKGILLLHHLTGAKNYPDLPNYRRAKFQAIIRHTNFEQGYQAALQVMDVYRNIKFITNENTYFDYIEPLHDPVAFPASTGDYIEYGVNFETTYVESRDNI